MESSLPLSYTLLQTRQHQAAASHNPHVDARITKTRQKILAVGLRILKENGLTTITHLRLSQESGVARGTIYRHWPKIPDLIVDILLSSTPLELKPIMSGDVRPDLINILQQIATYLATTGVTKIIFQSGKKSLESNDLNAIQQRLHETFSRPIMTILHRYFVITDHIFDDRIVSAMLIGPVIYEQLLGTPRLDLSLLVDHFLRGVEISNNL